MAPVTGGWRTTLAASIAGSTRCDRGVRLQADRGDRTRLRSSVPARALMVYGGAYRRQRASARRRLARARGRRPAPHGGKPASAHTVLLPPRVGADAHDIRRGIHRQWQLADPGSRRSNSRRGIAAPDFRLRGVDAVLRTAARRGHDRVAHVRRTGLDMSSLAHDHRAVAAHGGRACEACATVGGATRVRRQTGSEA